MIIDLPVPRAAFNQRVRVGVLVEFQPFDRGAVFVDAVLRVGDLEGVGILPRLGDALAALAIGFEERGEVHCLWSPLQG
jgi:hypothetical protein